MGRKIDYDAYVREYQKEARKHTMYLPMFSKKRFEVSYEGYKQGLIEAGKKPQNITRDLVRSQAYEISFKQGKALQKARESLGMPKMSIRDIRVLGKDDALDWSAIKEAQKEVKKIQGVIKDAKNKGLVEDDEDINEMINVASKGLTGDVGDIVRGFFNKYEEDHDPNDAFGAIETLTPLQLNKYIFGSD